jgi:2-polyprenyl-3-methyl-5-hydroxy-6-metoxy-1,4-benzoquinol methylase
MILDYGCGNGAFVHFLREQGYINAFGYDPYSKHFTDKTVLEKKYDVVLSQDVIEHVPDPKTYLHELFQYVKQDGGRLVIGTPDAERIDLDDPLAVIGHLHQPYHRHLITKNELSRLVENAGFKIIKKFDRIFVDTLWPFINSGFIFQYDLALGGAFDYGLRPIQYRVILKSPKLWLYGFLGRWLSKAQDVVVVARRKKANVST